MNGRRVYVPEPDDDTPHPLPKYYKPGDYWFDPTINSWLCCPPNGSIGTLANHEVIEHEDGTITVTPSILVESSWQPKHNYHGFLERGVWRNA